LSTGARDEPGVFAARARQVSCADGFMADSQTHAALVGELLGPYARRAEADLARYLVEGGTPATLAEAMRYCVLGGGKRIRPALVWLSAAAVGDGGAGRHEMLSRAASAVEMVHCYSLVHDDLPAMDDDQLRRGQPTAHVKFGQAMAILAGDALLTRAFAVLGEGGWHGDASPADGPLACRLVHELAAGAGPAGMIAGQVADMNLCLVPPGLEGMRYIHLRKTAALLRAAARMGGLCAAADERELAALSDGAQAVGLAFQLVDDLLDATASTAELGKASSKDAGAGKRSVVAEIGLAEARRLTEQTTRAAEAALAALGPRAGGLRHLARLLAERTR
jgi:geranylgeranyl pyrophosphate synthase